MSSTNANTPPSLVAARALVAEFVSHGVRDVVLAPGSRSAPLAYAVAEAANADLLRLHVRIDERAAAFLALGLTRGQAPEAVRPVAVVTTSGTAVANLHPAVLEAHHGQVPLLVLTADRPHELRGTGANQTTDQVNIFGSATRFAVDVPAPAGLAQEGPALRSLAARAVTAATGVRSGNPGPVHLNLSYRDPLAPLIETPTRECVVSGVVSPENTPEFAHSAIEVPVPTGRVLVVAGDGAGLRARELAQTRSWPLLAESVSGAAGGPNLVWAHAQVLAHAPIAQQVDKVIVLGRPTLSRPVQQLLARPNVHVTVISPGSGPWPDAANNAAVVLPAIPVNWLDPDATDRPDGAARNWLRNWCDAGQQVHASIAGALVTPTQGALTGPALAFKLCDFLAPDDTLILGSSSPVRDLDLVAAWTEPPRVLANRGLAGIDGMVSTSIGIALNVPPAKRWHEDGVVRALMGDLTFLHDVGGLLRAPGEPEPDLQIIVANDQGGSIFAGLEHGALAASSPERQTTFDRVFTTPQAVDLGALCAAYGVTHTRAANVIALTRALAAPPAGISVLEVALESAQRAAGMQELTAAIRLALNASA